MDLTYGHTTPNKTKYISRTEHPTCVGTADKKRSPITVAGIKDKVFYVNYLRSVLPYMNLEGFKFQLVESN